MWIHPLRAVVLILGLVLIVDTALAADAALIEAAKKEKQVVWYTTLIVNQVVRPMKAAFEAKYPGVELQFARADDAPTAAKISAEATAGRMQADVFDGITNVIALKRAGLTAPYTPSEAGKFPAETRDPQGYWHSILIFVFAPGINTSLVPKDQAPKTYQDLLDPKWKGKMAWNPSSVAGAIGFVGNIMLSMGDEKGMAYLKALSAQRPVNIEASSRAILDQVIAGEYPMGLMMFNHHAVISQQKGAPCDWLTIEPMPVTLNTLALLKDAPHPNAARLFVDFLTSEEGQQVIRKANYLPAMTSVPAMKSGLRPEDGHFKATYFAPDKIYDRIPGWTKIVSELFR